ncbi:hypothetical protein DFH09DRAFT_656025 [Mycena vulgaris]|nr:hypothetical protein DFH09DRAFT_656025 [Mycena vulgaris]
METNVLATPTPPLPDDGPPFRGGFGEGGRRGVGGQNRRGHRGRGRGRARGRGETLTLQAPPPQDVTDRGRGTVVRRASGGEERRIGRGGRGRGQGLGRGGAGEPQPQPPQIVNGRGRAAAVGAEGGRGRGGGRGEGVAAATTQSPASQDFSVPERGFARGRGRAARAPGGRGAATAPRGAQRGLEALPAAPQAAALPGDSGNVNGENHRGGQRGFARGQGRTAGAPGGRGAATAPRGEQRGRGAPPAAPQAAALPGDSGNVNGENHGGGQRGFARGQGRRAGAPGGRDATTTPRGAQRGRGALPAAPQAVALPGESGNGNGVNHRDEQRRRGDSSWNNRAQGSSLESGVSGCLQSATFYLPLAYCTFQYPGRHYQDLISTFGGVTGDLRMFYSD